GRRAAGGLRLRVVAGVQGREIVADVALHEGAPLIGCCCRRRGGLGRGSRLRGGGSGCRWLWRSCRGWRWHRCRWWRRGGRRWGWGCRGGWEGGWGPLG